MISKFRPQAMGLAAGMLVLCAGTSLAQAPPNVAVPAGTGGVARARLLARSVDALKLDDPRTAIAHGRQALALLAQTPDDSAHIVTLSEMGWAFMTIGAYDSASAYADSGRRMAARAGNLLGEARATSNLGSLAQRMGDPRQAVERFERALVLQREARADRDIANSLNNMGFVYSTDLADYEKALRFHLEALEVRERLGDEAAVALSLNNLGIVYNRLRQWDRALEHFGRALAIRRELGQRARVAATINNIGDVYLDMGRAAEGLRHHQEALSIRQALEDKAAVALSHRNIAVALLALQRLPDARRSLNLALANAAGTDQGLNVQIHLGLAAVSRAEGHTGDGERHARHALDIAERMGSRELVRQSAEELSRAQESTGQLGAALETYRRAKAVNDSIFTVETGRRIAQLEQRHSDAQRQHELERLRLESSRRASQRNLMVALVIALALAGAMLYRNRVARLRLAESLSITDTLTGVHNRRFLQQTIGMDVAASLRRYRGAAVRGHPVEDGDLILLMIDLDHFKHVNDAYGHAVGDRVLREVAHALQAACRDSDVMVRWGGEEFLVVARFTDRRQAPLAAERLRAAVATQVTRLSDGRELRVTCSVGFAAFPFLAPDPEALNWEQVLAIADLATYAAKDRGRNRWVGLAATDRFVPTRDSLTRAQDVAALVERGALVALGTAEPAEV